MNKKLLFYCPIILLIIFRLFFPQDYIIQYSPVDDNLFINISNSFITSTFNYHPYIISKSPGFPIFLFFLNKLSISYIFFLNLSIVLIYIIFLFLFKSFSCKEKFLVGFLFMFNPIFLSDQWYLILRDPLYSILFLLLIIFLYLNFNFDRFRKLIYSSILFLLTIFFFIREESFFIYSLLSIILLFMNDKLDLSNFYKFIFLPLIIFIILLFIQSNFNKYHYGVNIINDNVVGEFPKLINNIIKIDTNEKIDPGTPLTLKKLEVAANVSEDFTKIFNNLPSMNSNSASCQLHSNCNEWSLGFLIWEIKKSAYNLGLIKNHSEEQSFYKKISDEINFACKYRIIKCSYFQTYNSSNLINNFISNFLIFLKKLLFIKHKDINLNYEELKNEYKNVLIDNFNYFEISPEFKFVKRLFFYINMFIISLMNTFSFTTSLFQISKGNKLSKITYNFYVFIFVNLLILSGLSLSFGIFETRMIYPIYLVISLFSYVIFKDALKRIKS